MTADQLPDPESNDGYTWDHVTVTGWLRADRVDVDSVDLPPPANAATDDTERVPVEQLDAIWAVQLAPERGAVRGYTAAHADQFAGMWWDEDDLTLLVVAFTGDLGQHQAAIDGVWPHDFRVIQAAYTEHQLYEAADRLNADDVLRAELAGQLVSADVDIIRNLVHVDVAVDDHATRNAIGERYDLGMLVLRPELEIDENERHGV